MMVLEKNNFGFPDEPKPDIYIVIADESSKEFAFDLLEKLRRQGLICDTNFTGKSVKSQIKEADKMKAGYVIVIGENEIKSGKAVLKKLSDGSENEIDLSEKISL